MLYQITVRLREMMAAKEAAAGGERRRVHRFQNQVFERVYQGLFGDGIVAPEDEDEVLALLREGADGGIGELFPAVARMRGGLSGTHRQRGVEQQHPFPRPFLEVARTRHGHAEVVMQLLEDILQAGREGHAIGHRERKAMSLSRAVVRVLAQDNYFHLVEWREIEGIEDQRARRIDGILAFLVDEKGFQVGEIRGFELWPQHLVPAFVDIGLFYFHLYQLSVVQLFSCSMDFGSRNIPHHRKISAKMVIIREKMRYFANQI